MPRRKQEEKINNNDSQNLISNQEIFDEIVNVMKQHYPDCIFSGGEEAGLLICLPVPSLSVRYLLQQEGWPLNRFTMLVGEQESCKSSFLYEIIRWHNLQKGFGVVIDTEFKPAPELMWSILNYNYNACAYEKFKTLEGWCKGLKDSIQVTKTALDAKGRIIPFCFGVDALTSTLDEKEYNRLGKEGVPEKHFAVVAAMLTDYIKFITKELDEYPFSLVGINQLKPATSPTGATIRNISGGKGLRFHQAMEIELRRKSTINPTAKTQIRRIENGNIVNGVELQLAVMKNSNAPHEHISTEMLWYTDFNQKVKKYYKSENNEITEIEEYPQITFFDWHSSTTELILQILKENTRQSKQLKNILYIEGGYDRRYCYSPTLGVSQNDKISWREMGQLIEEKINSDREFRDELYPILGIRRRFMYRPGVDFRDLIQEAKSVKCELADKNHEIESNLQKLRESEQ